jgi:hypothetical protein
MGAGDIADEVELIKNKILNWYEFKCVQNVFFNTDYQSINFI